MDDKNKIFVLLVQPDKHPRLIEIENTFEAMQALIVEDIEEYMPFDDEVALVCADIENSKDRPLNRGIYAEKEVDMTYQEMKERFREREKEYGEHLTGYIVFSQDSFTKPYSQESRTYRVSSDNKAFQPHKGGYSIFADSLDFSDCRVRIEQYMTDEIGGKDGWKVERCYMKERELLDIVRGDFFLCKAEIENPDIESLPPEMVKKYSEMFKNPERFEKTENGYKAIPYKPVRADMER